MNRLIVHDNIFDYFPTPDDEEFFNEYKEFISSILSKRDNVYVRYSDCHHILPRCLGGTDDGNLIYLTYREHFLAHYYLARAYFFNYDLVFTSVMMGSSNKGITKEEKAEYYEESRKLYIDLQRSRMKSEDNPMRNPEIKERFFRDNPIIREKFIDMLHTNNPMTNQDSRLKVAESKMDKVWVNNGSDQTYVDREDLETYLNDGYSLGMIKRRNTRKDYDRHCKVCGVDYKGGKYSMMCKKCYSEMKGAQLALTRGGTK